MLVLTRKAGEGVMVGDEIEIRVNRVEGDFVKLAIRAPRNLPIYRNEVYKQIKDSNLAAVRKSGGELPQIRLPARPPSEKE